jgi:hypothetical protein
VGVNFYAYVRDNPVNGRDPLGLCGENCNPYGPPYHGTYPPGHVPWNVPYGPNVQAAYGQATGGPFNNNLNNVSRNFPNDPWSNCVRGCLLSAWDVCKKQYIPDFYTAHALCYTICAGSLILGGI